eukprot:CAMPEP_0194031130 /NCGR_PEP_ID=MMETSP0009_2-20130614/4381_1 /TAXON_ID=210454 /ORGANISM="Grammatophora oceanica, Strain CCMP 410" /LENGTH=125 /DNA_ID=CAMNT_0038671199 /DNA_START=134 /DNA_END=514 /DNA_ORIENTATION=-
MMMNDPMAGLDQQQPAQGASDSKEVLDTVALHLNTQRMNNLQTFMSIASGCMTGVLGLTGLQGFVSFLILHFSVLIAVLVLKMGFNLKKYSRHSFIGYALSNLQSSALSFMLFWTLFYGLVYLYD